MLKIKSNVYLMKNIADIKKEFGITSKKDLIDTFGLPANISTKEANKFLRQQYKATLSQLREADRLFRAKQKREGAKRIKKIKDNTTKFKQNQIDNVNFGDTKEELVWDKKYKLRITSKKTGKKLDINLTFKLNS